MKGFLTLLSGVRWLPILLGTVSFVAIGGTAYGVVNSYLDGRDRIVLLEQELEQKTQLHVEQVKAQNKELELQVTINSILQEKSKSLELLDLLEEDRERSRAEFVRQQIETNPQVKYIYEKTTDCPDAPVQLVW